MSYEGREQHICANGHLFEIDCRFSYDDEDTAQCSYCEAKSVWVNHIDDTNGEQYGIILQSEFKKLLIGSGKIETCNLGHAHVTSHNVYRIPKENELQQYYFRDNVFQAVS